MKTIQALALTTLVTLSAPAMAETSTQQPNDRRVELAQMDSPGDGLDADSASQGNGRPRGVTTANPSRSKAMTPVKKSSAKRHRNSRRR
ncbi:hypothetical protein ACYQR9_20845 [Methylobacterium sp. CM6241]